MRRSTHALLLSCFAALLLWPVASRAEEPETKVSPSEAYAAKLSQLPAPSAELGFRFEGILRHEQRQVGHGVFEAKPNAAGQWTVSDETRINMSPIPQVERATALLSKDLKLVSGGITTNKPGAPAIRWEPTEKGFRIFATATDGEVEVEEVRNVAHEGTSLTTMAGMLLFCRLALGTPAEYETSIFEVEHALKAEGKSIEVVKIQVLAPEELDGHKVLAVNAQKGTQDLKVLFHPETHAILGVRLTQDGKLMEILPGGRWSSQARDAKAAALRAGLAFATGNVEMLNDVIDWQSFHEAFLAARADKEKEPPTLAGFRNGMLKNWNTKLPKNPPQVIAHLLKSLEADLKGETEENGHVNFVFPAMFQGLDVTVGQFDGIWKLVSVKPPKK